MPLCKATAQGAQFRSWKKGANQMTRYLRNTLRTASLVALIASASTQASAAMLIAVCDDATCSGGNDVIVTDNGSGDTIPAVGAASTAVSAFGYSLLVNTSQSKPIIGSASSPQLDLTFTATTSDSILRSVYLYVSDTGFVNSGAYTLSLGGTNSGGSGTVTGRAYGGTTNTTLLFSNLIGTVGPETGAAYSDTSSGSFVSSANPYALTLGATITRSSAGTSTGDLNLQVGPVPEPATWAMMLLGFGGIGMAMRRSGRRNGVLTQIA